MVIIRKRSGETIILGTNGEKAMEAGLSMLSTNVLSPIWIRDEAKALIKHLQG